MTTFADLLDWHAAASFEKQLALADAIGDRTWSLSLSDGTITFGDDLTFPIQVLGTEGEAAGTWMWGWANAASNIPPQLLAVAEQMRALGEQQGIPELTAPTVGLDVVDGHRLAMIAAGVSGADCYYRCPYQGGAAFVLLHAPAIRRVADASATRFLIVFPQVISLFSVHHRAALTHYAAWKGWATNATPDGMDIHAADGTVIYARFDATGRLINLQSSLRQR